MRTMATVKGGKYDTRTCEIKNQREGFYQCDIFGVEELLWLPRENVRLWLEYTHVGEQEIVLPDGEVFLRDDFGKECK